MIWWLSLKTTGQTAFGFGPQKLGSGSGVVCGSIAKHASRRGEGHVVVGSTEIGLNYNALWLGGSPKICRDTSGIV